MSQGSDKNNSSDDLIAELARLMASEARGEPESDPVETVAVSAPVTPADLRLDEPINSVEHQDDYRLSIREEPRRSEPSFAPAPRSNPDVHQLAAEITQPVEPVKFQTAPVAEHHEKPEKQAHSPRFTSPASDSFAEPPAPRPAPDDAFDYGLSPKPYVDPRVDDNTPDHREAPEPVFQTPVATPSVEVTRDRYQAEAYATRTEPQHDSVPPAARPETEDPIAALIAAQLNEADAVQPGMVKSSYSYPPESSFSRAPARDFAAPRSAQGMPKASRDPLDDIESLIGAALRNDRASTPSSIHDEPVFQEPVARAAPAPLRQSSASNAADTAEAAILAATASMRRSDEPQFNALDDTRVGGINPQVDAPTNLRSRNQVPPKPKSAWRKIAGPTVAAGLLIALGLGLYWVFGQNNQVDGDAPVLSADSGPVKQAPDPTSAAPSSVVFSDTATDAPDTIERLISRDETADTAGNDVSRVIPSEGQDDGGLANRKVRTVTVRPDGTIVSGDAAVAGGEQLPIDRPNVPQLPGETAIASPIASAQATTANDSATSTAVSGNVTGVVAPVPLPRPSRSNSASVTRDSTPGAAITPVLSNSGSSNTNAVDLIANAASRAITAPAAPVAPQPSTALASGSSAPAYVQLSSQRSPEAAQQSLQRVQSRFAEQLGNNPLEVQQVDLGERGIYYRVRMPAKSVDAANAVCSDIKSGGGDCFVRTD